MTVRPFDFMDLPFLSRYRGALIPLHTARLLTHGNPLGVRAMLSYLNPRRFIHTAVASENGRSLMGQVILREEETSARLTFLAPGENAEELAAAILDHLSVRSAEWGAFHLLAELDEDSKVFRSLRKAGFTMYAWQRIWKLPKASAASASPWRRAEDADWPAIQSLHAQIVPALIQPIDALSRQAEGIICRQQDSLQAYASLTSGPAGLWVQPLVPPESGCSAELFSSLAAPGNRPVYVCVRSYQAWLETVLEELGAQPGPQQAVMVRRFAKLQKVDEKVSAMEKVLVKPVAPAARAVNGKQLEIKQ